MIISGKQNLILEEHKYFKFVEHKNDNCFLCDMSNSCKLFGMETVIPCYKEKRIDSKTGYFKEIENEN